jgi:hypothetical protein
MQHDPFPAVGDDSVFYLPEDARQKMLTAYKKGTRGVRNVLFLIAACVAIVDFLADFRLLTAGTVESLLAVAIYCCIVGTYIALGIWALKKPFYAVIAGIVFSFLLNLGFWLITGSFRSLSLLVFLLFLSVIRKAKALQKFPLTVTP